jgi:pyruvate kinase
LESVRTKLIIDRFEGDFVICEKEDRTALYLNRRELLIDAKEGDVLIVDDGNIKVETARMCS